ncbi:MAG: PilZ domain-containing protein [Candidatus Omnitrophota bacterium]
MQEKRRYIRLNSCFPVEFSLYFIPKEPISDEYQGFTSNVSEGGLSLKVRNLKEQDEQFIIKKRARLSLSIHIPLSSKTIQATADIVWCRRDERDSRGKTQIIGLSYKDIKQADRRAILNYALRMKWLPRIAVLVIISLLFGFLSLSCYNIGIERKNKKLVQKLVSVSEVKTDIEKKLNEARTHRDMLESRLLATTEYIEGIQDDIVKIEKKSYDEKDRLTKRLNETRLMQEVLESKIKELLGDESIKADMARKITEGRQREVLVEIDTLQMELEEIDKKAKTQTGSAVDDIKKLQEENALLLQEIEFTRQGETSLEEQLAKIKAKSGEIEAASVDRMLEWIKIHQVKRTGLVLSYEGDESLKNYGFTYDEALACQVFLVSGEKDRAKAILDFYLEKAKYSKGLFYSAYDVTDGSVLEYDVRTGPNIWMGISACQYTKHTGDEKYLSLAKNIANVIIKMQIASADGSIKGGPDVEWISTEHNLDAYALFDMLYILTRNQNYRDAATTSLEWVKDVGYNAPEDRFLRGKGDSTIATDTFSWAIASIKPITLLSYGMNPDSVMEFAENECRVEAVFTRPEGTKVSVVGFDFAKAQNVGRGGIISTEWTAQMVVAFNIMADYYKELGNKDKEKVYRIKAEYYLSELGKMVISSPSPTGQGEGCLPYASIDNVDTGHGWRVAKGHRTGSVAATAYYIFASKKHNPLSF